MSEPSPRTASSGAISSRSRSGQTTARVFRELAELHAAEGTSLGASAWLRIEQDRIDAFAAATEDFQWIHVDAERARTGPYGTTIAHGYLTLSLLPVLGEQVYSFAGWSSVVYDGLDRVRFPTPVRRDNRVRVEVDLVEVAARGTGAQVRLRHTVAVEGGERPGCVADMVVLLVP